MAYGLNLLAAVVERLGRANHLAAAIVSAAIGFAFVGFLEIRNPALVIVALVFLAAFLWRLGRSDTRRTLTTLGLAAAILGIGFGALQNLNHVAAVFTTGRLRDDTLRDADLAI